MPRIDLNVPYKQKDEAKRLGAKWDSTKKVWYVPDGLDPSPFQVWLPSSAAARTTVITPNISNRLVVEIDGQLPEHLFNPRRITSTDEIDDRFWVNDRIPLLTDDASLSKILISGGAEIDEAGPHIRRGAQIDFTVLNSYLPFVAKQIIVPILGDLIPLSSFGSNLSNLLTRVSWEELRQEIFKKTAFHCEICGTSQHLECHELWEYHEPLPEYYDKGGCGVQRLIRLMCLCRLCHETHHLGLASIKGRSGVVGDRIRAYNRWSKAEFFDYCDFINERSDRRTDYNWVLDVSSLAKELLIVDDRWNLQPDGFLSRQTRTGLSETMILGIAFKHAGKTHQAIT